MRTNGLALIVGLGFLVGPIAYCANQNISPQSVVWPNGVKEMPLYVPAPKPIPIRDTDSSAYNVLGIAQHVFFERTSHALMLGARVAW